MTEIRAWWCPSIGIGVGGSKRCKVSICTQDHNPLIEKGTEKAACLSFINARAQREKEVGALLGEGKSKEGEFSLYHWILSLADELEKADI